ncbi:MAG: hypothetical protein ACRDY0_13120 [Acidimicrobiales bacterium]
MLTGETIATIGDALARLSGRATHLDADAGRYWYALSPSVARLARDRAERLLAQGGDDIATFIAGLLAGEGKDRGLFAGVHPAPGGPADVPDAAEARLVLSTPKRLTSPPPPTHHHPRPSKTCATPSPWSGANRSPMPTAIPGSATKTWPPSPPAGSSSLRSVWPTWPSPPATPTSPPGPPR